MSIDETLSPGLRCVIPAVRRARGFMLYLENGRRLLDLYQDAGTAVLGYRPVNLNRVLNNALSRGLSGSFPTVYGARFEKALSSLFPGIATFRVYSSMEKARSALGQVGVRTLQDPVRGAPVWNDSPSMRNSTPGALLWRPFAGTGYSEFPVLIPVLPFPGFGNFVPVCAFQRLELPDSDAIPGAVLAGLTRIVYDLKWSLENGRVGDGTPLYPQDLSLWKRDGIYLVPLYAKADHPEVFSSFLEKGFLLPPDHSQPAILPGEWSAGERKLFRSTEKRAREGRVLNGV